MTAPGSWTDPAHPPVEATDLGGGVWVSWAGPFQETVGGVVQPLIWHWCDRSVIKATDTRPNVQPWWYEPRWECAGVKSHTLVSRDPLHLEPSLLLSDCCGLHGFVRDGRWMSV